MFWFVLLSLLWFCLILLRWLLVVWLFSLVCGFLSGCVVRLSIWCGGWYRFLFVMLIFGFCFLLVLFRLCLL